MEFLRIFLLLTVAGNALANKNTWYLNNRGVMVHLFEWKWADIADECERFLAPKGFGGVQVSSPCENAIITNRPWWERYQPISYKLITRSGDETAFKNMVDRCNKVGVRIYVDAVINHMTAGGKQGTGGSVANLEDKVYPEVPYGPENFNNPQCNIYNFADPIESRECELVGLHDLNLTMEYTRTKVVEYLNKLVDIGVAGFRVDAAVHMYPKDLKVIYDRLNNLSTTYFPPKARPYIYQEILDLGGGISKYEYTPIGAVTEFKFSNEIGKLFNGRNLLKYMANWGRSWGMMEQGDALVFVDNHDSQRVNSNEILSYKQAKRYKGAIAFTLAHPYGEPQIISSFAFDDFNQGPPQDSNQNIISPTINADGTCGNGWVCEHRWREIYQMVEFRNTVKCTGVNDWWDNGSNQISFCRGAKGFVAFNNDNYDLDQYLQTCLPGGKYCDIISGSKINNSCSGKTIEVYPDGKARIIINANEFNMILAFHIQSKIQY